MRPGKPYVFLFSFFAMIFYFSSVLGEDISNYSGCDVCEGAIHYGYAEARGIIGPEGMKLIAMLPKRPSVKIDLDGVRKPGSTNDPDAGFEIYAWGRDVIFIKHLYDESKIYIVADRQNASHGKFSEWYPEIYMETSHDNSIHLKDSVEKAWKKMKSSMIYEWMTQGHTGPSPGPVIGLKIRAILNLMRNQAREK